MTMHLLRVWLMRRCESSSISPLTQSQRFWIMSPTWTRLRCCFSRASAQALASAMSPGTFALPRATSDVVSASVGDSAAADTLQTNLWSFHAYTSSITFSLLTSSITMSIPVSDEVCHRRTLACTLSTGCWLPFDRPRMVRF
ncbi:hypothetical protein FIBSPDRAFT_226590 [Athelia psychrophila]|uniref:Uncharacterized protein n=1 Tax=Athelia psychrophila TaxID=1759441 RepID=A0A165YUP0_9AGAM|nr:hypothetical protein FIBSPDRAFT_226590 [Fibularhizoctonia sp. CBS 109695]